MKNIIVAFLVLIVIVLSSFLYKAIYKFKFSDFPEKDIEKIFDRKNSEPEMLLFIYFSKNNCHSCLEMIQELNNLEKRFKVIGVVPSEELKDKKLVRVITGATFKLVELDSEYKKFSPNYFPSIVGVNKAGNILFVLPLIPYNSGCLNNFLTVFYSRSYELLIE